MTGSLPAGRQARRREDDKAMKNKCYFNGKITTLDRVKISPYDLGLLRGYGVFDVMCSVSGKPFLLKEHFTRLKNSAKELNIKLPWDEKEYQKILEKLLDACNFKKATIRTIVTGGTSEDAFSFCGKLNSFIFIEKFHAFPEDIYEKGAKMITHEFERMIPRAKITNYVEAIRIQDKKKKAKALEILFVKDGKILEASTSNVFMVKDGKIVTPKDNILLGTTRNLVVKLAKDNGLEVEEREVSKDELDKAQEVFLTATNKHIVPIVNIDGQKVGNGKIGEKTKVLMKIFEDFVRNY